MTRVVCPTWATSYASYASYAFIWAIAFTAPAIAHELPDGVVQCGLQAVVRADRIELRYQVGLSATTARAYLKDWGAAIDVSEPVFPRFRDVFLQRAADGLRVEVDGVKRQLRPLSVKEVRRHHARIEVLFEFDNPLGDQHRHDIKVMDSHFAKAPGLREVAVKASGDIELTTDAPKVLGRSRIDLDEDQQLGPRELRFQLGMPGDPPAIVKSTWDPFWMRLGVGALAAIVATFVAANRAGRNSKQA